MKVPLVKTVGWELLSIKVAGDPDTLPRDLAIQTMKKVLRDREIVILDLRFGLSGAKPMILEAVGKKFKISRERVRQIQARSLAKLRGRLRRPPP